jgi:hypothetical protein
MCLIKGAFVGEKNFDVIKMHGTTIKKMICSCLLSNNVLLNTLHLHIYIVT